MTPHPYQNAYDAALAELTEITARFEQLRARKSLVENVIQALQPFFVTADAAATSVTDASTGIQLEEQPIAAQNADSSDGSPEGYSFQDVPSPLPDLDETGGDPFQRRVKSGFRFRGLATQRSF
jgi:hypothetical protein